MIENKTLKQRIEEELEKAGLGRKFDREIPLLAVKIELQKERQNVR